MSDYALLTTFNNIHKSENVVMTTGQDLQTSCLTPMPRLLPSNVLGSSMLLGTGILKQYLSQQTNGVNRILQHDLQAIHQAQLAERCLQFSLPSD